MSSRSRVGKQMGKRSRVKVTYVNSSGSPSESEDEVLHGAALKKQMAPTLRRYPAISHKSEESRKKYKKLFKRAIKPNRYIDAELLKLHGLFDGVKQLLKNVGSPDLLTANMFGWSEDTFRVLVNSTPFWQFLTQRQGVQYLASKATSSQIVNPVYRYIHKVLNHTIYGRGDGLGGVLKEVFKILYGMHHGIKLDYTSILAKRFTDVVNRADGSIVIGGFITRIAEKIGAFDRKKTNLVAVEAVRLKSHAPVSIVDPPPSFEPHTDEAGTSQTIPVRGTVRLKSHAPVSIVDPPPSFEPHTDEAEEKGGKNTRRGKKHLLSRGRTSIPTLGFQISLILTIKLLKFNYGDQ
ncbi:hypothetical protein POM88_053285 [Heracleum sosnowskyi]|uniref:Uncharacterized protein n=1 Tax=Heracleum sosnowskyi TaxID=360622 RepID=A0AAD8GQN8_9APIA|nr:hypothetical protein POM88_053285 [Heracleum sosnowskyi]